jgi:hypothetical protein
MAAEPRLLKRVRRVATNGHASANAGPNGNGHANGNGGTNGNGHTNGVTPQIATAEAV